MKNTTIIVTGIVAALVERAVRASVYGINGDRPACYQARRECRGPVEEHLARICPDWNSYGIINARVLDTAGTKTPYAAELTVMYD